MADLLILCRTTPEMDKHLAQHFDAVRLEEMSAPQEWLQAHGTDVRYILTDGHRGVSEAVLEMLPNLKLISSYGVGYDAIDTRVTNAARVPVTHTPDVLNEEVATTALMLCLAIWRDMENAMHHARSGDWAVKGARPLPHTADNRRVGILGLGRIGKAFARKLAPFHAEISYHGRTRQDVAYSYFDNLVTMARACDTLVCIAPGGEATKHLINAKVLEALGPQGYLVNVGRGSIVDEHALIAALRDRRIAAAGLDVFEDEPNIPAEMRALPNVVMTPHIGSATVETRFAMGKLAVDNLIAVKEGRDPLTPIPESRGLF
ncbi:2-hydroxyacid dehydrogenase [Shimia haliotis]|uniref:Lactate dehydrogenase n=1 Tax=Shimia haliotis TaxID=1280847 RepID=A0A1I4DHH5_9RHOB|nr:2-hydroxyacid dehydrogenase [Shimia haliotis]SFK92513.1 Lactate dehydrogenase [Shimia haliotis]